MKGLDDNILKEMEKEVREKIKEIKLNKYKSIGVISFEISIENGKLTKDDIRDVNQYLITLGEGIVTKSGYRYLVTHHYLVRREGKNSNTLRLYIARNEYCIDCLKYLTHHSNIPDPVGIMLYNLLLGNTPDKIEKILDDIFRDDFNNGEDNDEEV